MMGVTGYLIVRCEDLVTRNNRLREELVFLRQQLGEKKDLLVKRNEEVKTLQSPMISCLVLPKSTQVQCHG